MSAPVITGGEPAQKIVPCTDADMKDIQRLQNLGLGQTDPRAPVPEGVLNALIDIRRQREGETPGSRYQRYANSVRELIHSGDPRAEAEWKRANDALVNKQKLLGTSAVHNDATLSNMSVQYANDEYIGVQLMPAVPVQKQSDKYYIYDKQSGFQYPDDETGEYGAANEIKPKRSTSSYDCELRSLKRRVAAVTLANQDAPLNELMDMTEELAEARSFKREIRISDVLTTAGNYPTGNKVTLSGADQWNSASGGNPIKVMQDADAALFSGRAPSKKLAFSSLDIFHTLARHPQILGLFQYNGSSPGLATPDMIARWLGWDGYLVGRARKDTAKEGATASYSRIWGDFFGLVRVSTSPSPRMAAFGCTMRWQMRGVPGSNAGIITKQWFDPSVGLGGTYFAEMGEAEDHIIVASDCGYLVSDPLA